MTRRVTVKFRLYITRDTYNSAQAMANLEAFCRAHLPDRHEIEIIDVLREPRRAMAANILMTPTLVRLTPAPELRVIGTLSDILPLFQALGSEPRRCA
jgi:circadian clock protein KaiB